MPSSGGSFSPRDQTRISYVSCIGRWVLYHWVALVSALACWLGQSEITHKGSITHCSAQDTYSINPGSGPLLLFSH